MITYRNSASAALTAGGFGIDLPLPAGTQAGDFMIAHISYPQGGGTQITPPAGWTQLRTDQTATDSGAASGWIFTRVATSSEPATYTFTTENFRATSGGIIAYSGVKTAQPFDVTDASVTQSTTTPTSPSISTVYSAPQLIWLVAARDNFSGDTATPPAGMTQRWRANGIDGKGAGALSLVADQVFSGPGSSGAKAGVLSPAASAATQILFLNPADENPNHPPTANAGPDVSTQVGSGVVLDGSGSSDIDPGDTLTYAWSHISGPNGTTQLSATNVASPTFTPTAAGVDIFRLTVTDTSNASDSADVHVSTTPTGIRVASAAGTGGAISITVPSNAQAGDVAYCAMCFKPNNTPPTMPGWSAVQMATFGSSSTDISLYVFAKRLAAGDLGGVVTATNSDPFADDWSAQIVTASSLATPQLYNKVGATVPLGEATSFSNTVIGAGGSTTYTYTVTAIDAAGETITDRTSTVSGAPATLTSSNKVRLQWQPVFRATSYNVYGRTVGSQQLIATVSVPQNEVVDEYYYIYYDTGTSPSAQNPPTQQPPGWLVDGWTTEGDGTPAPERLFTTYANGRLLAFVAGHLPTPNTSATVSDPGSMTGLLTTNSSAGKMLLHAALQTLSSAGDVGTRLFTSSDYTERWATIALTLRPASANGTPIAIAGFDQLAEVDSTVYLDATQSYDEDGDTLSYSWAQTAGTTVTLSSSTAATPSFTMPASNVTFRLTAIDPGGLSSTDNVTITVRTAGQVKIQTSGGTWTPI